MRIKNFSRYSTSELEHLIKFACQGIAISNVLIEVRNDPRSAYRGRIYYRTRRGRERVHITMRIGPPTKFPTTNQSSTRRWVDTDQTPEQLNAQRRNWRCVQRRSPSQVGIVMVYQFLQEEKHPYGGKASPSITMNSWQEAVICVAAHEGRHLVQYRRKIARSEIECEEWAARILADYRNPPERLSQAACGPVAV